MDLARFIGERFSRFARRFSRSTDGPDHLRLGKRGERLAARQLRRSGYKILYRNFRAPRGGEVDIVCRHGDTLVFVEVKTRRSDRHGGAGEAVTHLKQRLITRGALAWLRLLDDPEIVARFDVVEVYLRDGEPPQIEIIENAFPLPDPFIA